MDIKTLEKMTVPKLRDEAMKFEDVIGAHGMNKTQLIEILKQKHGLIEKRTESEALIARKHAMKEKINTLKAEHEQARVAKNSEKADLVRERLRRQRRILKKLIRQTKAHKAKA